MLPKLKTDYSVANIPCPPGWTHSGPYNGSFICSNNCNGVYSYMNADEAGYKSNDPTDYCSSAKVYNPLENFSSNNSGFIRSKNCNKKQVEVDKTLTNGLSPKVQKFLLSQTSLASRKVECFHADTNLLQLGSLEVDDLVGGNTSSNPNNLGQAYVESNNDVICPAGFTFKDNNCQVWDDAIAESN
jgi:hypothetical protein